MHTSSQGWPHLHDLSCASRKKWCCLYNSKKRVRTEGCEHPDLCLVTRPTGDSLLTRSGEWQDALRSSFMKAHSFSRIRLCTQDVARCLLGNSRWGWGGFQHSLILNTNLKEYQLTCRNGLEHLKIVENPEKCLESGLIITMPQEETECSGSCLCSR